jgi:hypothetical protein
MNDVEIRPSSETKESSDQASQTGGTVDRGTLRAASYEEGSQALVPQEQLKYEQAVVGPVSDAAATKGPTPNGEVYSVRGAGTAAKGADGKETGWNTGGGYTTKAVGVGYGDRKSDTLVAKDAKDASKGEERKGEGVSISDVAKGAYKPNLKGITKAETNEYGSGLYTSTEAGWGTTSEGKADVPGVTFKDGKTEVKGPSYRGAAGGNARAAAGWKGEVEGDYGKLKGGAEAYGEAWLGADVNAAINQDGASLSGGVGIGAQAGVKASADYTTPGLKIAGVSKPLDAGVGVTGEAYVGAKAGAGGGVYLTKQKIGAAGTAGAFIGAEAKGDIHGHVGPVGGKLEGSVLAGAGAGVEGSIVYENGKLVIGGRAYAALGYGAKVGGSVTIDVAQSVELAAATLKKAAELGIDGARTAYRMADADNDGKLSATDGAKHATNAMDAGAKGLESGVDGMIGLLDAKKDGKFTSDDVAELGNQAYTGGKKVVDDGVEWATKKGSDAVDWAAKKGAQAVDGVKEGAKELAKAGFNALDADGDGDLDLKKDGAAAIEQASDSMSKTVDAALQEASKVQKFAGETVDRGLEVAKKAADDAWTFADRDGSGGVDTKDLVKGAGEVTDYAMAKGKAAADWTGQKVDEGVDWAAKKADDAGQWATKTASDAGDWAKQKATETLKTASDAVETAKKTIIEAPAKTVAVVKETAKAVYDAADLNRDGKVDATDASIAATRARQRAAAAAAAAKKKAAEIEAASREALAAAQKKAEQVLAASKKAVDFSGDGKVGWDDVSAGASQAKAAAYAKAKAVAKSASDAASAVQQDLSTAATTLRDGGSAALSRAGAALDRGYAFLFGS